MASTVAGLVMGELVIAGPREHVEAGASVSRVANRSQRTGRRSTPVERVRVGQGLSGFKMVVHELFHRPDGGG